MLLKLHLAARFTCIMILSPFRNLLPSHYFAFEIGHSHTYLFQI